jgi:hypothetical protein
MSLFSCAFFLAASFLLALLLLLPEVVEVEVEAVAVAVDEAVLFVSVFSCLPLGLKLVSRFLDLESSRPVPRIALKSRSTDSCRVDFGDFVVSVNGWGGGG